jgi:hypothetical protein
MSEDEALLDSGFGTHKIICFWAGCEQPGESGSQYGKPPFQRFSSPRNNVTLLKLATVSICQGQADQLRFPEMQTFSAEMKGVGMRWPSLLRFDFRSTRERRLEAEIPSFKLHLDSAIQTRQPGEWSQSACDLLRCSRCGSEHDDVNRTSRRWFDTEPTCDGSSPVRKTPVWRIGGPRCLRVHTDGCPGPPLWH